MRLKLQKSFYLLLHNKRPTSHELFSKIDKDIGSYRDIIRKYGKEYKFSANQIAKLDRDLKIPINTVDVCKDGRSREARQKSGKKVLHIKKLKKEN